MKDVIIVECGPTNPDVTTQFWYTAEGIISIIKETECSFKWVKVYLGETINNNEADA